MNSSRGHQPPRLYAVPDRHRLAAERRLHAVEGAADPMETSSNEDGIHTVNCVTCDGFHDTDWDRVKVDVSRTWDSGVTIFVAWFPCPNKPGPDLQHWLNDVEFTDAVIGGAELTEKAETQATIVRFRSWLAHPGTTGDAAGWSGPDGSDAA